MKIIKDPVHGYIDVEEFIIPLLDSPFLQRLRHIKQLGFSYLVYPGANHTRFEHSLGTMYLADIMCRQLGVPGDERALVLAAALLHDIGHGPYSHSIEPVMREFTGMEHHDISGLVEDDSIALSLGAIGTTPGELAGVVGGKHR
ncbi:MAG: HD domain-containing protein, partial [Methanoregulaceae archaeon]|nr:HD domain-containing protein [Methanoregulaceae archaeon]